ncbi:MAG: prepilin-type N-terminal cleavage/methylation domain-containing protein [Candidatus Aegiribacteria sp.]|nr:prepilin-type N-terminal cleavage/methylation domain-containing protein [Candidatus Aegiribacteria sp.]
MLLPVGNKFWYTFSQGRYSIVKRGFTLIELMIVVVIIGIISAIAIPKFGDIKTDSQKSSCRSNLRNLASGMNMYFAERNAYPRRIENLDCMIANASEMRCPSASGSSFGRAGRYTVYGYVYTSGSTTYSYYYSVCFYVFPEHGYFWDGVSSWERGWTPE